MSARREAERALSAALAGMADQTGEPLQQIYDLESALPLDPGNAALIDRIARLKARVESGPVYVAVERVVVLGRATRSYEGQIYVELPDGTLKPINGQDLVELHDRFPDFIKRWKPGTDEAMG